MINDVDIRGIGNATYNATSSIFLNGGGNVIPNRVVTGLALPYVIYKDDDISYDISTGIITINGSYKFIEASTQIFWGNGTLTGRYATFLSTGSASTLACKEDALAGTSTWCFQQMYVKLVIPQGINSFRFMAYQNSGSPITLTTDAGRIPFAQITVYK